MKRKFAILLVFCFSVLSILTGCNLFDTNNYAALSSTVATNGDVTITREQLINAYNAGGYYYASIYGLSQEDAFKRIINELVDDAYYTLEVEDAVSTVDNYKLTSQDYSDVVRSVWDYPSSARPVLSPCFIMSPTHPSPALLPWPSLEADDGVRIS